jgi:small conductance mechanosensitive channel
MITNYSKKGSIRLDIKLQVPYEESFPKVKEIIAFVLDTIPKVLKDPRPQVGIEHFDNFFIQISIKPFVHPNDFTDVTYEIRQKIKTTLGQNGVRVRYPDSVSLGDFGA